MNKKNFIAKELRTKKYRPRVVKPKKGKGSFKRKKKINLSLFFTLISIFYLYMNKQSIIIYDFEVLFNILNEVKENLKFQLFKVKSNEELQMNHNQYKNEEKNYRL